VKSKIPCFPGFLPVIKEDQAGKVAGGMVDSKIPEVPELISSPILGNLPSITQGLIRSNVAPSSPMIKIGNLFTSSFYCTITVTPISYGNDTHFVAWLDRNKVKT